MKYILFLMFSIIMNILIMTSPIMILLMILLISFLMSLMIAFKFSSWYGFLMFLIYIGAMLVMFSYFVALVPNQYFNYKKLMYIFPIFFLLLLINMFFFKNNYINKLNFMYMTTYMYENNNLLTMLFLIMLLLLMMFMITKMVNFSKGPLRPFKYVY